MPFNGTHRLWIDFETDGLYRGSTPPNVMEFAAVLMPVDSFDIEDALFKFTSVFHLHADHRRDMPEFVQEMHTKNGLLELVDDPTLPEPAAIGRLVVATMIRHGVESRHVQLAGAGIAPFDLPLLREDGVMRELYEFCHYQPFDISTGTRVLEGMFGFEETDIPQPESDHRAMGDVELALATCQYYRDNYQFSRKPVAKPDLDPETCGLCGGSMEGAPFRYHEVCPSPSPS